MIRLSFQLNIDRPKWWARLFPCRHEVVSVEENKWSRYGTHSLYMYCLKCGRKAMDIQRNCTHEENGFGVCDLCRERLSKHDCEHKWCEEPDTDDEYCELCGEWKGV